MPNVVCTPHLGYVVRENYESMYSVAVDNMLAFAAGRPSNIINPEVLRKN
jgi:D-3-phosphoglycerate dehydrogenase